MILEPFYDIAEVYNILLRKKMIESLPEDFEIHIYSCNKLNHRWHIVLMKNGEEIQNIRSMTLDHGMTKMEEYLDSFEGECNKEHIREFSPNFDGGNKSWIL